MCFYLPSRKHQPQDAFLLSFFLSLSEKMCFYLPSRKDQPQDAFLLLWPVHVYAIKVCQ